jgi:hypothetical protein
MRPEGENSLLGIRPAFLIGTTSVEDKKLEHTQKKYLTGDLSISDVRKGFLAPDAKPRTIVMTSATPQSTILTDKTMLEKLIDIDRMTMDNIVAIWRVVSKLPAYDDYKSAELPRFVDRTFYNANESKVNYFIMSKVKTKDKLENLKKMKLVLGASKQYYDLVSLNFTDTNIVAPVVDSVDLKPIIAKAEPIAPISQQPRIVISNTDQPVRIITPEAYKAMRNTTLKGVIINNVLRQQDNQNVQPVVRNALSTLIRSRGWDFDKGDFHI